jgi:hypothetical protein
MKKPSGVNAYRTAQVTFKVDKGDVSREALAPFDRGGREHAKVHRRGKIDELRGCDQLSSPNLETLTR